MSTERYSQSDYEIAIQEWQSAFEKEITEPENNPLKGKVSIFMSKSKGRGVQRKERELKILLHRGDGTCFTLPSEGNIEKGVDDWIANIYQDFDNGVIDKEEMFQSNLNQLIQEYLIGRSDTQALR